VRPRAKAIPSPAKQISVHCRLKSRIRRASRRNFITTDFIHLRTSVWNRTLIDQAAALAGISRSQFILASALREARNALLNQTTIRADAAAFQKILLWLDNEPGEEEMAGMKRLLNRRALGRD